MSLRRRRWSLRGWWRSSGCYRARFRHHLLKRNLMKKKNPRWSFRALRSEGLAWGQSAGAWGRWWRWKRFQFLQLLKPGPRFRTACSWRCFVGRADWWVLSWYQSAGWFSTLSKDATMLKVFGFVLDVFECFNVNKSAGC